jgi:zinc protease
MDRTLQPAFQQSLAFTLPIPERISLSGQGEICYLQSSLSEAVKIEFVFEAGRYVEPQPGVAQFTAHMLDKGLPGKDANQIANVLDYYGAHLEVNAGYDFTSVSLYALRKNLKKLLPLLLSIFSEPLFPEKELDNYRKIFIENLKVNQEKNAFLAANRIRKNIFGSHPYGSNIEIADAEAIAIPLLKSFFQKNFNPFKVFIIGTIEEDDLQFLSRNINFRDTDHSPSVIPLAMIPSKVEKLDGPNKVQASIKMGRRTIPRLHPDVAGLQLANHLLGGFFGSRLMKNIREEKGLTYGIHSSVQNLSHATSLNISADVNADKLDMALEEIQKELELLATLSDSELEIAKNHLIGSFQNDITTIFAAGEKIKTIILSNLPADYYQGLINSISAIQVEDIRQVSKKHLSVDGFSTVVVR